MFGKFISKHLQTRPKSQISAYKSPPRKHSLTEPYNIYNWTNAQELISFDKAEASSLTAINDCVAC